MSTRRGGRPTAAGTHDGSDRTPTRIRQPVGHLILPAVILSRFLGDIRVDTVQNLVFRTGPLHVVTAGSIICTSNMSRTSTAKWPDSRRFSSPVSNIQTTRSLTTVTVRESVMTQGGRSIELTRGILVLTPTLNSAKMRSK